MPRNELIWSYHVPWRCKDAPQCSMLQMLSAHSSQLCNKTQAPSQSILLRRAPSVLRDHLVPSPFTHTSNIVSTVPARPPAPARLRPRHRGKPTEDLESCRIWTLAEDISLHTTCIRSTSDTPFAVWEADLQPCVAPLQQATLSATLVLGFRCLSLLLPAVPVSAAIGMSTDCYRSSCCLSNLVPCRWWMP